MTALFETLRWSLTDGYVRLPLHLSRMQCSALALGIPWDGEKIRSLTKVQEPRDVTSDRRVKIVLRSDGAFELTYLPITPLPDPYRVALSPFRIDATDPLMRHKRVDRTVYVQAREAVSGVDDVILQNRDNNLTESTIANIILEIDGRLYTPPLECGVLPGVLRGEMVRQGELVERLLTVGDLDTAQRVLFVNSLRGVWTVDRVP